MLKRMAPYPLQKQVVIPIACAIVHNFILMIRERDELLARYNCDGVPVGEIDPNNAEVDVQNVDEPEEIQASSFISRP